MDQLQAMVRFVRVAEWGSFTKAADQLGLPKASVSAAVTQLEARLGTRLFHRTTRRVTLTQDGQEYLDQCRALIAALDDLESQFQRSPAEVGGCIRVDMPGRMASHVVIPRLPEFFARYPKLQVELGSADRRVDLVTEGFDCVVRVGDLSDSSLVARTLAEVPVVNCVSPGYLDQRGEPRSPLELANHLLVKYSTSLGARPENFEYVEGGDIRTAEMPGAITVNGTETYLAACLAGLGIAQVPWISVRHLVREGRLKLVLRDYQAAPMPISLLYPSRRHPAKRVVLFMDWLRDILDEALNEVD